MLSDNLTILIKAQSTRQLRWGSMDFEAVLRVVGGVPSAYAVLAAALGGLLGVLIFCYAVGCFGGSREKEGVEEKPEVLDELEAKETKQQTKNKGGKPKQPSSKPKSSLPPHPLLAAEFKGHTGAVVSLDFDVNGKYLATSSDGKCLDTVDPQLSEHPWSLTSSGK